MISPPWWTLFMEEFRKQPQISPAARAAGTTRHKVLHWLEKSPTLKEELDDAREMSLDLLELEYRTMAMQGVDKQVVYQGKKMYERDATGELVKDENDNPIPLMILEKNPVLIERILKAERPEKWSEKFSGEKDTGKAPELAAIRDQLFERLAKRMPPEEETGDTKDGDIN